MLGIVLVLGFFLVLHQRFLLDEHFRWEYQFHKPKFGLDKNYNDLEVHHDDRKWLWHKIPKQFGNSHKCNQPEISHLGAW